MSFLIFFLFLVFPHAAHAGDINLPRSKPPKLAGSRPSLASSRSRSPSPKLKGSIVRSDKWIIRREKGEEEFQGNVSYHQGGYRFKSDWALYRKKSGHWKARGNVYCSMTWDDGAKAECYGDHGEYFQDTGQGAVFSDEQDSPLSRGIGRRQSLPNGKGRVEVSYCGPDHGTWHSYSDRATLNKPESLLTLLGNVLIKSATMQAMSDSAVYDNLESVLTLSGGYPVAYGATEGGYDYTFAIQGDTIKIYSKPLEKMTAYGKVQGWLRNKK